MYIIVSHIRGMPVSHCLLLMFNGSSKPTCKSFMSSLVKMGILFIIACEGIICVMINCALLQISMYVYMHLCNVLYVHVAETQFCLQYQTIMFTL